MTDKKGNGDGEEYSSLGNVPDYPIEINEEIPEEMDPLEEVEDRREYSSSSPQIYVLQSNEKKKPNRGDYSNILNTNMIIDTSNETYTELELLTILLSQEEKNKVPFMFNSFFQRIMYSFLYAFIGMYYALKHHLYKYIIAEVSVCLTCSVFCAYVFSIVLIIFFLIFSLLPITIPLALPFLYWVCELIVEFLLARGMIRMSYVEEHRMKGSDYNFAICSKVRSGEDTDYYRSILVTSLNLCGSLFLRFCRQLIFFIVIPFLSSFLEIIPPLYYLFLAYAWSLNFGYSSFSTSVLPRKNRTFVQSLIWGFKHHNIILGYGFASSLLYLIPVVNIWFYLFCGIGATRFYVHYEEAKRMEVERTQKWREQQRLLNFQNEKDTNNNLIIHSTTEQQQRGDDESKEETKVIMVPPPKVKNNVDDDFSVNQSENDIDTVQKRE